MHKRETRAASCRATCRLLLALWSRTEGRLLTLSLRKIPPIGRLGIVCFLPLIPSLISSAVTCYFDAALAGKKFLPAALATFSVSDIALGALVNTMLFVVPPVVAGCLLVFRLFRVPVVWARLLSFVGVAELRALLPSVLLLPALGVLAATSNHGLLMLLVPPSLFFVIAFATTLQLVSKPIARASRSRCPYCGYLLRGLQSGLCPECGNPHTASAAEGKGEVIDDDVLRASISFSRTAGYRYRLSSSVAYRLSFLSKTVLIVVCLCAAVVSWGTFVRAKTLLQQLRSSDYTQVSIQTQLGPVTSFGLSKKWTRGCEDLLKSAVRENARVHGNAGVVDEDGRSILLMALDGESPKAFLDSLGISATEKVRVGDRAWYVEVTTGSTRTAVLDDDPSVAVFARDSTNGARWTSGEFLEFLASIRFR